MDLDNRPGDGKPSRGLKLFGISVKEKSKIDEFFLRLCISSPSPNDEVMAFRFLAARKFNLQEAIELHIAYKAFLKTEHITSINPLDEDTRRELLSGKFTILNDNDPSGARVVQFFVRFHRPTRSSHHAVLQSVIFQLETALRKETAVRNGIILIYDMTNSKYSNFDADLSKKLFKMLKSSYPVRLRRIIVLTAPLWFRAPFHLLRVFIKEELRDRVHVVRPTPGSRLASLSNPDPVLAQRAHYDWLTTALIETDSLPPTSAQTPVDSDEGSNLRKWIAKAVRLLSSSTSSPRRPSIASYFDRSQTMGRVGGGTDRRSSSVSDLSDAGDEDDQCSSLTSSEAGDETSMSPSWDPLTLSSSQSSGTEYSEHSSSLDCTPNQQTIFSRPTLDYAATNGNVDKEEEENETWNVKNSMKLIDVTHPKGRDPAGTPTPPAVPKFVSLASLSMGATRPRPTTMITYKDTDAEDQLVVSTGSSDLATPTSDTVVAYPGSKPPFFGSASSPSSNSASYFSSLSSSNSITCSPCRSLLRTLPPSPLRSTATVHLSSSKKNKNSSSSSLSCPTVAAKDSTGSCAVLIRRKWTGGTESPKLIKGGGLRHLKQAPLAAQDDEFEENTIRKEKRVKQNSISIVHSLDLIPHWSLNRPNGDSIHLGPGVYLKQQFTNSVDSTLSDNCEPVSCKRNFEETSPTSPSSPLKNYIAQTTSSRPDSSAKHASTNIVSSGTTDVDENEEKEELIPELTEEEEDEAAEDVYENEDAEIENLIDFNSKWMDASQLNNHVLVSGVGRLTDEYTAVCHIKSEDPCTAFRRPCNSTKNRYVDVTCLEHSRVQLKTPLPPDYLPNSAGKSAKTEKLAPVYIHANWVDSFRQRNAFICTQGPLPDTTGDFWYMVWTYHVPVIVMITRCYESQRCKCYQYWPANKDQSLRFTAITPSVSLLKSHQTGLKKPYSLARRSASEVTGSSKLIFEITHVESDVHEDYTCTRLRLNHVNSGQSRSVEHFAFHSWPDHGVPTDTTALLELLATVQKTYVDTICSELNYTTAYDNQIPPPPIVVHCSAGIGRTGTFIALDISTKQLMEGGRVNIPLTVSRIRSQRSGCVQVSAQYIFVYLAMLDFAVSKGLLTEEESAQSKIELGPPPAHLDQQPLFLNTAGIFEPISSNFLSAIANDPVQFNALMKFLQSRATLRTSPGCVPGTTDSDYEEEEDDDDDVKKEEELIEEIATEDEDEGLIEEIATEDEQEQDDNKKKTIEGIATNKVDEADKQSVKQAPSQDGFSSSASINAQSLLVPCYQDQNESHSYLESSSDEEARMNKEQTSCSSSAIQKPTSSNNVSIKATQF